MATGLSSQKLLKKGVLEEELCTGCGACVGLCPYQVIYHDRTVQLHYCDLEDGKCYAFCPRTTTDLSALRELLFNSDDLTPEIGAVKGYYFSRAADPRLREIAQHGGTVTALMELALDERFVDSVIVSSCDQEFSQKGTVVNKKAALRNNASIKFTVSPTVAAFNQSVNDKSGKIGVVATPCQALALAKMRLKPILVDSGKIDQLQLVIGLYCGWTLSAVRFTKLLAQYNIAPNSLKGMDIPAGKNILELYTDNNTQAVPFDTVQACVREACHYCLDSTSEYADISVGSARFGNDWEEMRRWNQLIVRTAKGKKLVEVAVKNKALEIREAPMESLQELKKEAIKKKNTALKNIIRKSGSAKNLLYLDRHDPIVQKLLKNKASDK